MRLFVTGTDTGVGKTFPLFSGRCAAGRSEGGHICHAERLEEDHLQDTFHEEQVIASARFTS